MLRPSHKSSGLRSGSPHTVARPCRLSTGFPRANANRCVYKAQARFPGHPNADAVQKSCFVACLLLALAACGARSAQSVPRAIPSGETRIVSLMPSLTEDLIALGAGKQLVAVDEFSGAMPGLEHLPRVGDFSSVASERIVQLHPDVVVGIPSQERLLQPLRQAGIQTQLLRDDSFEDIFRDLKVLGAASGHAAQENALEKKLRSQTAALARSAHFSHHPSVFVVLDTSPIYTTGRSSYIATLIRLAGGRNAADGLTAAYAPYSSEALLRSQPDVLITDGSTGLAAALQAEPWRSLRAVQLHHVYVVEPREILERPGPRYNEGLQWLIAHLAPLAR